MKIIGCRPSIGIYGDGQMQKEGYNMQDVRSELGVRFLWWKMEKCCLERIGHVLRMLDDWMFGCDGRHGQTGNKSHESDG